MFGRATITLGIGPHSSLRRVKSLRHSFGLGAKPLPRCRRVQEIYGRVQALLPEVRVNRDRSDNEKKYFASYVCAHM